MKHNILWFRYIFMSGISAMLVSSNSLSGKFHDVRTQLTAHNYGHIFWPQNWLWHQGVPPFEDSCLRLRHKFIRTIHQPEWINPLAECSSRPNKILAKTPKSHRQPSVARVVCHFASDANIILRKETTNDPLRGIGLLHWTALQVQAGSRMWRYQTRLLHSWLQADETRMRQKVPHFFIHYNKLELKSVLGMYCTMFHLFVIPTPKSNHKMIIAHQPKHRRFFISKSRYQSKHWCHQDISALVQQEPVLPSKTPNETWPVLGWWDSCPPRSWGSDKS